MKFHHRLGVLAVSIQLALPTSSHALVLKPVKIDSSQGEPLYAEIPFSEANGNGPVRASLAQPFEAGKAQAIDERKMPNINFYVRRTGEGEGVIVLTSSQPTEATALDLLIKVDDGDQTKVHEVRGRLPSRVDRLQKQLEPQTAKTLVVDENEEKKVNLPTVSQTVSTNEKPLTISDNLPPPLIAKNGTPQPVPPSDTPAAQSQNKLNIGLSAIANQPNQNVAPNTFVLTDARPTMPATPPVTAQTRPQPSTTNTANNASKDNKATKKAATSNNSSAAGVDQHTVQANQTLWEIAQQIAIRNKVSTDKVMKQIYDNNRDAFINGQANMLKQGAVLSLPYEYQAAVRPAASNNNATARNQNTQPAQQGTARQQTRPAAPATTAAAVATPAPAKPQLSVVANNTGTASGTGQGTASAGKVTEGMISQIQKMRLGTWEVQSRVKTMDQELKAKQQRIAMLDARLAELQQQLNATKDKKPANNTTANATAAGAKPATVSAIASTGLASVVALQTDFSSITTLLSGLIS
ncbi:MULTISPECIES: FimV family protein [unclassified Acinetobacter]|uniref:type IV pilus assembly protein FimV n=1 Tax=unclassified Acinetobacter TaxID=196816 RepID=UPI0035B742D4